MSCSKLRSGASLPSPALLALSCVGFIAASPANAQSANEEKTLKGVTVTSTAVDEVKVERTESPKYTRPLLDTSQTITVISSATMQQQNLLSLQEVLSTSVPGITFGAGEGGGGYGDSITLRGYAASSDITLDGVRDSAQYTRSDQFNVEQIEVTNGANSVYNGGGSVGGNINLVTKRPKAEDAISLLGGVGTDEYYRATIDANKRVNDLVAVRLNGMFHRNDVPGRDYERYRRWGVAPSVTVGVDGPTSLTLQYYHQEDTNIPQYGVPYYKNAVNDGPLPGVSDSAYFGYRNIDRQRLNLDVATGIFSHEFSDNLSLRNLARYSNTRQFSLVNPPQGTYCLANRTLPTGAACAATQAAGTYIPSGPRGTTRDSLNNLWYNQTDLNATISTGAIEHTVVFGAFYLSEDYRLSNGNSLRTAAGVAPTVLPTMSITTPDSLYTGPVNFIVTGRSYGELENYGAYLFDTMKVGEKIEFNAGLRYEKAKGNNRSDTVALPSAGSGTTQGATFGNSDTLFSYRFGLNYKPTPDGSIYVAYGNSKTPSKTSVNGSCTALTCNVKPETAVN